MIRTILYALWLPILVLVVSAVRFGFTMPLEGPGLMGIVTLFALAWPAAIPLTLAIRRLHRRSRILAYGCAVVLGLGSAWTVILGGLFGPIGVVLYTLIASLPAWILLGILAKFQGDMGSQPSNA